MAIRLGPRASSEARWACQCQGAMLVLILLIVTQAPLSVVGEADAASARLAWREVVGAPGVSLSGPGHTRSAAAAATFRSSEIWLDPGRVVLTPPNETPIPGECQRAPLSNYTPSATENKSRPCWNTLRMLVVGRWCSAESPVCSHTYNSLCCVPHSP